MADLPSLLAVLEQHPDDAQALEALKGAARHATADVRATRFDHARKALVTKGRPDVAVALFDIELGATEDANRRGDLLLEKGMVLNDDLLDVPAARRAFEEALAIRPDDAMAREALDDLDVAASNWQKFAEKYIKEASASTDRSLATSLLVSAAEAFVRFAPESTEAEGYLRKALEVDGRNSKAAFHLARLLRRQQRWNELAALLDQRAELAPSVEEKVSALLALAEIARAHLADADGAARADTAIKRVLLLDAAQPQALRQVAEEHMAAGNWLALVGVYQAALKAGRRDRESEDLGILLQIAMVLWKHVGDLDQAEEYFRRVRKIEPAHPAALDFYRVYYPQRGENQKLLAMLRQVEKSPRARTDSGGQRPLGVEIAELAEAQNNPEKAIEAWKQHLRQDPSSSQARTALARLYRKTDKWNALLDLMKEEIERLPESDVAGRVARLHEIVEIYRDKLRLDVMVINTYNAILKIDPDNRRATDELAAKFRALGRWNDLIAVLTRKSEAADVPVDERVPLLREIADLWAERFGNFANAIKPLERILELDPSDETSLLRLKEIYTKRRQWRALIDVLAREASVLPPEEKRAKQAEMARLAAERLGDTRLAIEIFNTILMEVGPDHAETLVSLAALYEREKRWLGLAEVLHRQIAALRASQQPSNAPVIAMYEKLGQVYVDRLGAPQQAAKVWQEVLDLEPGHAKALRTLRELYATAGDFAGLEALYARLGQEDELVDALLGIADRLEQKAQRLPLVERAAQLAQQRADAAAGGAVVSEGRSSRTRRPAGGAQQDAPTAALERARQVWERVLAVEPYHIGAAKALAPIYAKQEKWAKLVTLLEIELSAAPDVPARLAKIAEIRQICEQKLTSRTLAFTWTLRAFDLDPGSEQLFADVLRLASEVEQWREVAAMFEKHTRGDLPGETKLRLYRELAKIATRRLGDPERARNYHRQVLALAPGDKAAEAALEELATQVADWSELLESYRRRAAREQDAVEKATLLVEIATLQEEKLVDLDGAAATYRETLQVAPGNRRALRSLAKIEEARGDWEALSSVLAMELQQTSDPQARFDLLMRLGTLEEQALERFEQALAYYRDALAVPGPGGAIRQPALVAVSRYLPSSGPGAKVAPSARVGAARLILPHLEASKNLIQQAIALEVIRTNETTSAEERLEIDRQLMRLYHTDLGDPASAWAAGLRIFAAEPGDRDVRGALGVLAGQLGRDGEWAHHLAAGMANVKANGPSSELRSMATELAQLTADRLGDRTTAERAWLTVLEVEADAPDAFDALADFYRADERWNDLRALLERRAEITGNDRIRVEAVLELADLEERVLQQPGRAAAAHRRLLELEPTYLPSYQALDRLYSAAQQWPELEELLARTGDIVDARTRDQLLYRRAELFAHRLGDPVRAIDLLEDVISRQPGYLEARALLEELMPHPAVAQRVARLLEPLYESDLQWGELASVLRAQRTTATGTEAVELLSRIAGIEENQLGGAARAFDAWVEVLALDPTHERARNEIARLAQQLGRWTEATQALERAADAAPEGDAVTRGALLGELATYYDTQLGDSPRAIASYRRLLETDASSPATVRKAAAALARLYDQSAAWPELRGVMKKQAEWAESTDDRRALLARVAALEEEQLRDKPAAISTWRDILADSPVDAAALNALERLYQATEQWRDLIDILRRKLDHADETESRELLGRVAIIHEAMLDEPEEAIAAYLELVDRTAASGVPDAHALTELARLYRASERHADLLDVLERQTLFVDPARRVDLQIEIARLLAGPLVRPVESLERWKEILQENPLHADATAAVEAALADPELRVLAADILRPVYDITSQHERLAALQLRASEWADEPATKLRALVEVVRIREHRLGDKQGAFAVQLMALQQAATEPELPQAVAETERLAGELGREADLIDAYIAVAPNVLDSEIQRRLYLDIADLSRAVRRDHELAREYYQKVLDAVPDDRRSLMALEAIYRDTNDDERLTEVLLRQADAPGVDVEDRVMSLVEAAGLYVALRRPDDAISTWEQVLATAPERRDAVQALESLYREQGRWPDVVDLYERRLGFATSVEEAVGLRVHIGEIHEKQLRDFETAIDNYSAALSGDPQNQVALAAVERFLVDPDLRVVAAEVLEPIYVSQHRWHDLIRVYDARLESATDPADRLRLTKFVARLYEEQLEDFENASRWYAKVFRENPSDASIRDQLHRLGTVVENWGFVAETYQAYLDEEAGESPEIRDVAVAAATIYDRRLGDVDRAAAAYRRALAIQIEGAAPDERELLRRTEELLGRAGKHAELVAVYDEVIARADDELRLEALIKRARLLEHGLGDAVRAIEGWREVVLATESGDSPRAYRDAVVELERLYRERSEWRALVDLFESRLTRVDHPTETAELRLKLAETFEYQLGDIAAAIDQYEQVIEEGMMWKKAVDALERLVVHDEHRERIIDLLEPVYRQEDWWEKLVVILDAKLEFVRDPVEQVMTLHEIASIHEDRGGALDLALEALARAWRSDVADEESLRKLLALAGRLAAWDEAVATLEEGAQSAGTGELAASLWARTAEIHETKRSDLPRAIDAWRKVEESHPDDLAALAALDRLLTLTNRIDELVVVIARRADLTEDPDTRLVLLHRVAATYEETLVDKPKAIEAYKAVLGVDDADAEALDALERLYTETGDGRELAQILERKIELCAELPARQELRFAAAKVYEDKLSDVYQAIGQLTAAHDDDANDPRALAELDRVYEREKMWNELLDILDKRTALATAAADKAELAFRGARLVEKQLNDPEAAIPRFGNVLQLAPSHAGAREALEKLMAADDNVDAATAILESVYRADREAAGLVRVYERRLAVDPSRASTATDRRSDWAALADVYETLAGQPAQAFHVWSRAIEATPEDVELLAPLIRLAEGDASGTLWRDLAARLDQLLEASLSVDVEQAYAMKLGQIAEDRLGDLERASRAYERATAGADPSEALLALERVLARSSRWADLAGVLRRQADAAGSDAQTAEYLMKLGQLQEITLGDPRSAVAAYREVLNIDAAHAGGRAALERMLKSAPDQRAEIVEILEPLFEQDADGPRLVKVLEARLDVTRDPIDRASLLARLVDLNEDQLGDFGGALDAALRWLADDPASVQALQEIDRLGERVNQWPEVASRISAIVGAPDAQQREPAIQAALYAFLGRIQRERLQQFEPAARSYRAALALEPESLAALDPLIEILRQTKDDRALAEALRQRGRVVTEPAERRAAFAEVAAICERGGDRTAAIAAWREVADNDDNDREALDELAALYRITGDKQELIDTLTRAARLSPNSDDEKQLRIEIAQLEGEGPKAIAAWQAVVDLDGDDLAAMGQLEQALARAGEWNAVADLQMRRLSLATTNDDRIAIQSQIARIAEEKRGSVDDAVLGWYAVLDIDNSHEPAYAELERLLRSANRWHDVVDLLERRAELEAARGNSAAELAALARAADTWEKELDNPDAAGEILEKILARDPSSVAALTRLSKIHERAGDWDKCKATLEQALRLSPTGRDAADLFFRLGEVARVGDSDVDTAAQHFQQALRHDATHDGAVAAMEKIARDRKDGALLSDMLQRRVQTVKVPADRVALYVEIAELERRANRADAALAALAKAAEDAPGDARVMGPLADLYFATGRLDEAAPIYDRLAEEAKAGRRMKDVARYRQRQGGILEARGDRAGALAAYEEALRVNPSDVTTMTGLGRLYFESKDWEKARRIYQSLVLSKFDSDIGVTKGEVYWALGNIHLQLGQPPKAKSMFQRGLEEEPGNQRLREALSSLS